jgi:hypothetical protein
MAHDAPDIDWIVREVAARLRALDAAPRSPAGERPDLSIAARVVTLGEVEGRLEGVARVRVERGAIVTPAVRDRLADAGVQLVRNSSTDQSPTGASGAALAIASVDAPYHPPDLLRDAGVPLRMVVASSVTAAVAKLCDVVLRDAVAAVLLTRDAAAAACLANRRRGIRAVVVERADRGEAIFRGVGANLAIFDAGVLDERGLAELISTFHRGAPWRRPAEWILELS